MHQDIKVGSIWFDKSGEMPVIVLCSNKEEQRVSFEYLLAIDGNLDTTKSHSSVDVFLKTKEPMAALSHSNKEYVTGLDKLQSEHLYNDGYTDGHNDCIEELHSHMSENELEAKKQGYEEGYDEGYDDGFNTAIKEMKPEKLNSEVCGSDIPNKETREAMQEVLGRDDAVNSPKHYNSDPSGVQCIEITRHRNNNIGNVIKYLWRNGLKDGNSSIQDLEKGAWYLNDEIQRLKGIRNGLE